MDPVPLSSPSSPITVLPQVLTSHILTLSTLLNRYLFPLSQASQLSSPTQLTRRLPRTRSRTHLSSRASLESIVEEPSGDGSETPLTQATPNVMPDPKREQNHIPVTVLRPQGWNGKNGITTGRGMRDVCGIWCVGLFGSGTVSPLTY